MIKATLTCGLLHLKTKVFLVIYLPRNFLYPFKKQQNWNIFPILNGKCFATTDEQNSISNSLNNKNIG